jgi:fructosamine-3-kinase
MQILARLDSLGDGVHRIALPGGERAVVKRRRAAPSGFFTMEAYGLDLLRAAGTLRVPAVLALRADAIVLEDLGAGRARHGAWERAGCGLARLHRRAAATFGLDRDGWCGASPQPNTPMSDGWRFFAECRLLPQGRRARDAGRLDAADIAAFGTPAAGFFSAYEAEAGIDSSWRSRAQCYNLYHLLNHLNLFGAGYFGAVREALRSA